MATGSTEELLKCDICLDKLQSPRALPCLHSFCESCLKQHMETSKKLHSRTTNQFPCPTCRRPTDMPKDGVKGFPVDFRINQLKDVLKLTERKEIQKCELCPADVKKNTARNYCLECKKLFCKLCCTKHQRSKVLKSHDLINVSDLKEPISACKEHNREPVKFICRSCDTEICLFCVLGNHENHNVSSIDDIYGTNVNKLTSIDNIYGTNVNILTSIDYIYGTNVNELTVSLNHIEDQISLVNGRIFDITCLEGRNRSMYVEHKLENRRKHNKYSTGPGDKVSKELDESYKLQSQNLKREKDLCYQYLEQFKMMQEKLESINQGGNSGILIQTYRNVLQEVLNIDLKPELNKSKLDEYSLTHAKVKNYHDTGKYALAEQKHLPFLEHKGHNSTHLLSRQGENALSALSQIPLVMKYKIKTSDLHLTRNVPDVSTILLPRQPYNPAKYQSKYFQKLKLAYEIEGYGRNPGSLNLPFGIAFLPGNILAVAENGSGRIQKFDCNGISLECINLKSGYPRCLTAGPNNEIFITDEHNKCVKKIHMGNQTIIKYSKDCVHFPYGIVALRDGNLVVSDMIYERLTIMKPSGETILQFGCHGYTNSTFDNPSYLATDGINIIVSDSGHHQVKVFDKTGKFLRKMGSFGSDNGELKYPKGIAVTRQGSIIVADSGNNRVVMFSTTGEYSITLLDINDNIDRPIDVACSSCGLLAVAMPDRNKISVYKLDALIHNF